MPHKRSVRIVRGTRPGRPPIQRQRDRAEQCQRASTVHGEGRVLRINRSSGVILDNKGREIFFTKSDVVDRQPIRVADTVEWRGILLGSGAIIRAKGVRFLRRAVVEQQLPDRPLGGLDSRDWRLCPTWGEMVRAFAASQRTAS